MDNYTDNTAQNQNVERISDPEVILNLIQKLLFSLPVQSRKPLIELLYSHTCSECGAECSVPQQKIAEALGNKSHSAIANKFPKKNMKGGDNK